MYDLIKTAISKGAKLYPNISGGKDGQAMTKVLVLNGFKIESLMHCDLGRIEWPESMEQCLKQAAEFNAPLQIIKRNDKRDMIDHWKHRMNQLKGQNKPFWSSSQARYCTADLKRDPSDNFYRNCGHDIIISCEGIRAAESQARAKKTPLHVRPRASHKMYKDMTAAEAIENFVPGKRLSITWYPIFHFSLEEVWQTYQMDDKALQVARTCYKDTGIVPSWWPFHPAYAYGNQRVSCKFCVLGCPGDLKVAASHDPELLEELIGMEDESGFPFRDGFSLRELLN